MAGLGFSGILGGRESAGCPESLPEHPTSERAHFSNLGHRGPERPLGVGREHLIEALDSCEGRWRVTFLVFD